MNRLSEHETRHRGFTLIEMLFVMFILAILTSTALALYIQGSHHFARTSTDLDAEREARAAMGYTAGELRQAMAPLGLTNGVPVQSPQALLPNPSPTPTSQVVFYKVDDITQGLSGTTVDTGNLEYDMVVIEPSPVPSSSAAPDLMEYVYDQTGSTLKESRVIGHDVENFAVTPLAQDEYAISITTAPLIRVDLIDSSNPNVYKYTLNSTIHVSYFPTNN